MRPYVHHRQIPTTPAMMNPRKVRNTQCWPICRADISIGTTIGERRVDTYPENQMSVLSVPTVTGVMREETPGVLVVLVLHENAHPS